MWFNFLDPAVKAEKKPAPASESPAPTATVEEETPTDDTGAPSDGQTDSEESNPTADSSTAEQSFESSAPIGYDVGQQLQDFTLTCFDGSEFHLADTRGKVTFINLWATYCTPCVQELPHFSALYKEHEGDIAMIAVHSSIVTDDPEEYLANKDWAMPFALDTDDDTLWDIVNGSTTLPQTIVLNRRGEVIYNQKGSVTPEMLAALYEQAAAG